MLQAVAPYQKVSRTFVFEKQQTMQSQIHQLEIDWGGDRIDVASILRAHIPPRAVVSLYDPNANAFVPLRKLAPEGHLLPKRLLEPSVILLRYSQKMEQNSDDGSSSQFQVNSGERRDMRSRERTVVEAIELVKRWRELHLSCPKPNNARKKVNLQEAAKMLGVSKKSLDDYYCQLRLAEQYGFDFSKHRHDKMGVLRSFVKDRKADEEKQQLRPHRHPKNLKIIEEFQLDPQILPPPQRRTDLSPSLDSGKAPSQPVRSTAQLRSCVYPQGLTEINALQSQYYRGFEFLLDDPSDPFLALNKDFTKRILDDQSDAILFL